MRAVVTRPVDDAERIATPLRARGVDILVEPLLAVVPAAAVEVDLDGVQAFLVTSANGARALAAAVGSDAAARAMPALAVGDQTAQTLEEHGFTDVRSADGDVKALVALVRRDLRPAGGALFHAAGSKVAGDLAGELEQAGYGVRRQVLYETRSAAAFTADLRKALGDGTVDAVFLFSPRTAETFVQLAGKAELTDACRTVTAYCLSEAVADKLKEIPFKTVRVAPRPRQDALLAVFDEDYPEGVATMTDGGKDDSKGESKEGDAKTQTGNAPGGTREKSAAPPSAAKAESKGAAGGAAGKPSGTATAAAAPPQPAKSATAKATAPSAARPAHKTPAATVAILVLLAVVVLLGAWGSLPLWVERVPDPLRPYAEALIPAPPVSPALEAVGQLRQTVDGLRADLSAADSAVADLRARLDDLESRPVSAAPVPGSVELSAGVAARLAEVESRLAALSTDGGRDKLVEEVQALDARVEDLAANRAAAASVLSLSDRVADLEGQVRKAVGRQDKALAFLLAVGQLREAVDSGRPFDAQLRTTAAVAPGAVDVAAASSGFASYAARGVPTKIALRQRLEALSAAAIRAAAQPQDGDSWINRTVDRLTQVVTVRRTEGDAVGDGPAAVTSRAEAALAGGDLGAAAAEIARLEGPAAGVMADWLTDARARLAAEEGVARLTGDALAQVQGQSMVDERASETVGRPQSPAAAGREG